MEEIIEAIKHLEKALNSNELEFQADKNDIVKTIKILNDIIKYT